jgi:Spy/CpxP family protein refolding chaperone
MTYESAEKALDRQTKSQKQMKRRLLTLLAAGAIAAGGFAIAQTENQDNCAGRVWHHRGNRLEHMSEALHLTPEQKAKVQPILDQAKPQIVAIHQDAIQKTKAVMDNTMSQIRPLLTPEQQKKADDLRTAHQELREAVKKMHDAASD